MSAAPRPGGGWNRFRVAGLREKFVGTVALILFLVSVFILFFFPMRQQREMTKYLKDKGLAIAEMTGHSAAAGLVFEDPSAVAKALEGLSTLSDVEYAVVLNKDGRSFAALRGDRSGNRTKDAWEAIEKEGGFRTEGESLVCVTPIREGKDRVGTVVLAMSRRPLAEAVSRSRWMALAVSGGILVFGIAATWLMTTRLVRSLNVAVTIANRLAQGDLTAQIQVVSEDESGQLLFAMQKMVDNLRAMLGVIIETARSVASSAEEISRTAERLASGVDGHLAAAEETASTMVQMAAQIRTVAKNSQDLASNVDETSVSIQQMSTLIQHTAENSSVLLEAAEGTIEALTRLKDSLEAVGTSFGEVDDASKKAVKEAGDGSTVLKNALQTMNQRSKDIGQIIRTIEAIADQTNLLALNAAIEAARAGDAGRGFAVVADEVRKLAERSVVSTHDITKVIESMQGDLNESVTLTHEILRNIYAAVERTSEVAGEVHRLIKEQASGAGQVVGVAGRIGDVSRSVATAAQEQATGSREILTAITSMNAMTLQVADATVEQRKGGEMVVQAIESIAAVARESQALVQQVTASAKRLEARSEGLKQQVERFHL